MKTTLKIISRTLLLFILLLYFSITEARSATRQNHQHRIITSLSASAVFEGDFNAIKKRGRLRILVPANIQGGQYLPRKGSPVSQQQEVAEAFAHFHQLIPELIIVNDFAQMIPALVAGKGDILVANLTITPTRQGQISFSIPLAHVRENILVSTSNQDIKSVSDLNQKRVMVSAASTFWDALHWLKNNKYKEMLLFPRPAGMLDEEELDLVTNGTIDATIRDSNVTEMYAGYRDDFKVAANFSNQSNIAWGVRKNATGLLNSLNQFLLLENLLEDPDQIHTDDFDAIKKRKVLRVLLRNNASSYFLYKGELLGFEYEMAKAFAKEHGLRLEVVVPPDHNKLLSWLVEGRADLAISFLQPTEKRKSLGITFSEPYNNEMQHVIVHKDDKLRNLDSMQARTFKVRRSSVYWDTLMNLKQKGYPITPEAADEDLETEELLKEVAAGTIKTTLATTHILDIELAKSLPVKSAFTVGDKLPQAVALREQNPQLVKAINAFIRKNQKSEFYNVLYRKYFKSRTSIQKLAKGRIENIDRNKLSPWDAITRKYADKYGFDWRLVTAQMYQESRFNPKAKSFAGARGLMQLMPKTAESVGVTNIDSPEHNIEGGIKYMVWLRDRFEADIPLSEKSWFALAAYNAGYGHVLDALRLAKLKGWDHKRWFNHTEKAMLLLGKESYAKKARYGYVDGEEPVNYVRKIRHRFEAYSELEHEKQAAFISLSQATR